MASIIRLPNGRKRLELTVDGVRRKLGLGVISLKQAETVRMRVEELQVARVTGRLEEESARWLAGLDAMLHERLAALGLAAPRMAARPSRRRRKKLTLRRLIDRYLATRHVKASTLAAYGRTKRLLLKYFRLKKGEDGRRRGYPARRITEEKAILWEKWLREQRKLAPATIAKRIQDARQIFAAGVRWGLLKQDPFANFHATRPVNTQRQYFVPAAAIDKILEHCPDTEWKAIVALARWGGLRCPSELVALEWGHVSWEEKKITVQCVKTERHQGHETRVIPLFPELETVLLEHFGQCEPGEARVLQKHARAGGGSNLRTGLLRIMHRAGVAPWPKLFQNMRSTRETELAEMYPQHVVCAWLGNSPTIARKHYLQVTDEHYRRATQGQEQPAARAEPAKKEVRKP